jgi:hypothetical protein
MARTATTSAEATDVEAVSARVCDPRDELAGLLVRVEQVVGRIDPDAVLARHAPPVWDLCDRGAKLFVGAQTRMARRVEDSGAYKRSGARSTAEYLALRSGTSNQAAAEMLATSRALPGLPATEAAVRGGQLSSIQAHYIASAAVCDPGSEAALLGLVVGLGGKVSNKELRDESLRVKHAADPDPEATRRRHRRERYLRQGTTAEGAWWFSGRGTTDDAGRFNAALNPLIEEIFRKARNEGRSDPREAYAYDGLQELARRTRGASGCEISPDRKQQPGPAHATGEEPRPETHPTGPPARTRRTTNLSLLPVLRLELAALQRGHLMPGELCEITGIGPVTLGAARDLLGESIVKLVLTRAGEVVSVTHVGRSPANPTHLAIVHADITTLSATCLDEAVETCTLAGVGPVGTDAARHLLGELAGRDLLGDVMNRGRDVACFVHLGRQPTIAQRVALLWTQPTCSVQGCPRTFTQLDHRHDWHKHQVTELANLDRLCPHHHRLKTTSNYQLVAGTGNRALVPPGDPRHLDNQRTASRNRDPPRAA